MIFHYRWVKYLTMFQNAYMKFIEVWLVGVIVYIDFIYFSNSYTEAVLLFIISLSFASTFQIQSMSAIHYLFLLIFYGLAMFPLILAQTSFQLPCLGIRKAIYVKYNYQLKHSVILIKAIGKAVSAKS